MNHEKCPCCPNHCEVNNLDCDKGKEYYNHLNVSKVSTVNDKIVNQLRKCGHFLHHRNLAEINFLSTLSNDELNDLHRLLSKVSDNIE